MKTSGYTGNKFEVEFSLDSIIRDKSSVCFQYSALNVDLRLATVQTFPAKCPIVFGQRALTLIGSGQRENSVWPFVDSVARGQTVAVVCLGLLHINIAVVFTRYNIQEALV